MQDRLAHIKNSKALHSLIIIIVGFIIYSKSFHNSFLGDDIVNIAISQTLASPIGSRYITFLTFAINYHLAGFNVEGYHLFNLLLHIANSILIYILLQLIFRTPIFLNSATHNNNSKIIAFIAAMLFLTHPIQTTSVYFITVRMVSLTTFFYLLTIIMYLKSRLNILESKGYTLYMLSAFIFTIFAMKSKEISFTIPVSIMLAEFTFFYKKTTRRELIYLFLFFLTFLIIPLGRLDLIDHRGLFGASTFNGQTALISKYEYFLTQFRVIIGYLKSLFFPINLHWAPYYHLSRSFFEIKTITSFILLFFIFSSAVYMLKYGLHKKKGEISLLSFGILWFFITLSVESSIIPIEDLALDYRTYLPSVGFFIVISAMLYVSMKKLDRYIPLLFIFFFLLIVIYSINSYTRHTVFRNNITLWADSVSRDPENLLANFLHGMHLYGDYGEKRYREALPFLLKAHNSNDENFKARLHHKGLDSVLSKVINDCYLNIGGLEKKGMK